MQWLSSAKPRLAHTEGTCAGDAPRATRARRKSQASEKAHASRFISCNTEQRTWCSNPCPGEVFSSLRAGHRLPSPQTCVRARSVLCNICARAAPLSLSLPQKQLTRQHSGCQGSPRPGAGFVCTPSGLPCQHSLVCGSKGVTEPTGDVHHHHSSVYTLPKPPCPCLSPGHTQGDGREV